MFTGNWAESCGCRCGYLPTTMTVSPTGVSRPPGSVGAAAEFELVGTLFGGGAKGSIYFPTKSDSPAAIADAGTLLLTERGSCYAKVGRVAPFLRAVARKEQKGVAMMTIQVADG